MSRVAAPQILDAKPDGTIIASPTIAPQNEPFSARNVDPFTFAPQIRNAANDRAPIPASHVEHCGAWNTYWAWERSLGHLMGQLERDDKGNYSAGHLQNAQGFAYTFVTGDMLARNSWDLGTHDFYVHGYVRVGADNRVYNNEGLVLLVEPRQAKEARSKFTADFNQERSRKEATQQLEQASYDTNNIANNKAAMEHIKQGTHLRADDRPEHGLNSILER